MGFFTPKSVGIEVRIGALDGGTLQLRSMPNGEGADEGREDGKVGLTRGVDCKNASTTGLTRGVDCKDASAITVAERGQILVVGRERKRRRRKSWIGGYKDKIGKTIRIS